METSERKPYPVTDEVVRQRTDAATRHGGQSEHQIRSVARAHKRRLLRQMGVRIGDLDGIALALIDNWARGFAKVTILDAFYLEQGLIRDGKEVDPSLRVYYTGLNSSRIALERLSQHLARQSTPGESLQDYIDQTYGPNDD